jgi:hypothetical protein
LMSVLFGMVPPSAQNFRGYSDGVPGCKGLSPGYGDAFLEGAARAALL